jgi:hypothetical protein
MVKLAKVGMAKAAAMAKKLEAKESKRCEWRRALLRCYDPFRLDWGLQD